ncbi:FecCD family ABC transporter permease [Corynebacterium vitaeruminis]|uniref:FecCD family ABC transporter permease n=1 Tax=Corynebacterium vitaeruminis TaxID=38305 RepID=UPI0022B05AFD|nr:iron chelate uptake ABC transporter family permease subunit [Corynebacterium vitaeruminis]
MWALDRRQGVDTYRLVLVGIGVNAFLHALVTYMLAATDLNTAAAAKVWMVGSVNGRTFDQLWPTLAVLAACSLVLARIAYHLPVLELGDDLASSLGVPLKKVNATLLVVSIVLAAVAVSAVGPVGFVAFVAPQLALRLTRASAPPLAASAVVGALLTCASDLVARSAFPWEVPVGIVTVVIGGPFLIWLLWQQSKTRTR